jgi:hypothetical protein
MVARELIEARRQDEVACFELDQAFAELAVETQAETYDPDNPNRDCYVCARCKNNTARRIRESRIVCERTGCLDIDLKFNGFSVEQVMLALQQVLEEHKAEAIAKNESCGGKEECTEITVRLIANNEDEFFEEVGKASKSKERMDEQIDPSSLVLFVSCKACSFLDCNTIQ